MLTLGDVLAAIAILLTTSLAALSAMVLSSLLFPDRTARAATEIERHPWKCAMAGFFAGLPLVLIGLVLFQVPHPVVRVLGLLVMLLVLMLAAAGSGGLAQLAGKRILTASADRTQLSAITLGGVLVVGVASLPLAGWLILAPMLLLCSLGAGVRAFRPAKRAVPSAVPEAQ
jgi:hypothetical protein